MPWQVKLVGKQAWGRGFQIEASSRGWSQLGVVDPHMPLLGLCIEPGRTLSMPAGRCCCAVPAVPCPISKKLLLSCEQARTNLAQPFFGILAAYGE